MKGKRRNITQMLIPAEWMVQLKLKAENVKEEKENENEEKEKEKKITSEKAKANKTRKVTAPSRRKKRLKLDCTQKGIRQYLYNNISKNKL